MARTALATQLIAISGLETAYTAANADGHSVANNGEMFLHVKNAAVADITVTLVSVADPWGRTGDREVTVTAEEERMIGPIPPLLFNQADGTVSVNFSAVTTVTVAAIRLR